MTFQPPSAAFNSSASFIAHMAEHPFMNVSPGSAGSTANTYHLPSSPVKGRKAMGMGDALPRPTVQRTVGQRPACLVNASITYVGNNQLIAFGGFDQYTDEVYNHVLKLDLNTLNWSLVDNYGDIPGVRMGHTACLWQGSKLLVYGGENEHRDYLSDVVVFDVKTATWTSPDLRGPTPRGRARHAAVVHDDKLFILGGLTGSGDPSTLDEICYLDLRTWTWSRSWSFVPRFDHAAAVWGGRMWVFGGLGPDMEHSNELWWLDLQSSPAFKSPPAYGSGGHDGPPASQRLQLAPSAVPPRPGFGSYHVHGQPPTGGGGRQAPNSSSIQVRSLGQPRPVAPGAICSMRFTSGPNVPAQQIGAHFHAFSSGALLDFVTGGPSTGTMRPADCNLSALELSTFQWQGLAEGAEIFEPGYGWKYCVLNAEQTKAWLLGCPMDVDGQHGGGGGMQEEYLSEILPLDLKRFGLLGPDTSPDVRIGIGKLPASDRHASSSLSGLGADLASVFDQPPESGSGTDFVITAERDDDGADDDMASSSTAGAGADPAILTPTGQSLSSASADAAAAAAASDVSPPIHVHRLILQARWPHFCRAYAAQMAEFHTRKMHIEEPYRVVRAFAWYLYTDSIARHPLHCPGLAEVAGMLVLAHLYDMPRLRGLCVHRLGRELDVEGAACVWERAGAAQEAWLRKRAATFCLTHWGRVVRTEGFRRLGRAAMMELCEVVDVEGRVVGGEELEVIGGLGGGRLGLGGSGRAAGRGRGAAGGGGLLDADELDADDDGDMVVDLT